MLIFRGVEFLSVRCVCFRIWRTRTAFARAFSPGRKVKFQLGWGVFLVDEWSGISSLCTRIAAENGSCDVSENHCDLDTPEVEHNT